MMFTRKILIRSTDGSFVVRLYGRVPGEGENTGGIIRGEGVIGAVSPTCGRFQLLG